MKNSRIRASIDEIAKSLQGNWRPSICFALKQALAPSTSSARSWPSAIRRSSSNCKACKLTTATPAKGKEAWPGPQRAQVRSAHAAVQDVRRGSDAHRRHRRHHGAGGDQRE
jgi:hypothetical protein